jgi:hypothetical protein
MIRRALLAALAATALLACSDDDNNTGPNTDLSGSYTLQSFQQGDNPVLSPPIATGTLVLTATTYNVTINAAGQQLVDQGTYTTNGNQFSQTGTLGQATGTFTQSGNTFSTDLTTAAGRIRSTWLKQ